MGFGAYDEDEHESREEKKDFEMTDEKKSDGHNGDVTVENGEDTDKLLNQLEKVKEQK